MFLLAYFFGLNFIESYMLERDCLMVTFMVSLKIYKSIIFIVVPERLRRLFLSVFFLT